MQSRHMMTLVDFIIELALSTLQLVSTFVTEVFLGVGLITAMIFVIGAVLTTVTVGYSSLLLGGTMLTAFTDWGGSARETTPPDRKP